MDSGAFDAINVDLNVGDAAAVERVLPRARGLGLGVLAREAFFKGDLFRIGAEAGIVDRALLARAAMQWLAQQQTDCLIVGVDNAEQLRANARAYAEPMGAAEREVLERLRASAAFTAFEARKRAEFLEQQA
jgi:aryl-alcohol dehydrogenase-like predicted oxidoreductase